MPVCRSPLTVSGNSRRKRLCKSVRRKGYSNSRAALMRPQETSSTTDPPSPGVAPAPKQQTVQEEIGVRIRFGGNIQCIEILPIGSGPAIAVADPHIETDDLTSLQLGNKAFSGVVPQHSVERRNRELDDPEDRVFSIYAPRPLPRREGSPSSRPTTSRSLAAGLR